APGKPGQLPISRLFWPAHFPGLIRRIQSFLDSVCGDLIRGDNYSAYGCAARDKSPAHERWCRTNIAVHDYSKFSRHLQKTDGLAALLALGVVVVGGDVAQPLCNKKQ